MPKDTLCERMSALPPVTTLIDRFDATANQPTFFRPLEENEISGLQWLWNVAKIIGNTTLDGIDRVTDVMDTIPTKRKLFGTRLIFEEQYDQLHQARRNWRKDTITSLAKGLRRQPMISRGRGGTRDIPDEVHWSEHDA